MKLLLILACLSLTGAFDDHDAQPNNKYYRPEWSDLDGRPLPEWYDRAKIGIFIHWGVYSVPAFGSEWFWQSWKTGQSPNYIEFMNKNYAPGFSYQDFAPMFTAEFYDPHQWAELFVRSGAKYVVLTSKHHDGYTLFPSKRSFGWNSVEVGAKRDLVGTLAEAVKEKGLKFGVYHSLYEWFNPVYLEDQSNSFETRAFPDTKVWPDLKQLVNDYEPSIIWSDGDWDNTDTYWNSTGFIAWLYNDSPVKDEIVVNDRWGQGTYCNHGDIYNCADRYNPGALQTHKWENAFTLDSHSWGYRRNIQLHEMLTINDIIEETTSTVSCGGNVLINVGPTKEGTITPIYQERLIQLGNWLRINGDAIYNTSPWLSQKDSYNPDVWYTCTKDQYNGHDPTAPPSTTDTIRYVYAVSLKWPTDNVLKIKDITKHLNNTVGVKLLGNEENDLQWTIANGETNIMFPDKSKVRSEYSWTIKFIF